MKNNQQKHWLPQLSSWLEDSPEGLETLTIQADLWSALVGDFKGGRVLLVDGPSKAWCDFFKHQNMVATAFPPPPYGDTTSTVVKESDLPFSDNEFDITAFMGTLEYMDKPLEALEEAIRISRKGVIVITRNGSWAARLKFIWETGNFPPLKNHFSKRTLFEMIFSSCAIQSFKTISGNINHKSPLNRPKIFDPWLGFYFTPKYTMSANEIFVKTGDKEQFETVSSCR